MPGMGGTEGRAPRAATITSGCSSFARAGVTSVFSRTSMFFSREIIRA